MVNGGQSLMAGQLDEISLAIGRIESRMSNVEKTVQCLRVESRDEHRKVHEIIDALSESNRTLADTMKWVRPLVENYRTQQDEARGARKLLIFLYTVGGGAAAMIGDRLISLFMSKP